jgi:hypothetical protein
LLVGKESKSYMGSHKQIKDRLRDQPFKPVRIIASEGQRFDVYHPDLMFVGERDIMVRFPSDSEPSLYDRVTRVALVHIVGLEDLPPRATSANGET